jgi:2-keto-3-deoxy-L-rhamnonate aldolase RhmA
MLSKLREGKPTIGGWVALSDPYCVEVMASAGYDWLVVDTEHCPIGPESLRNILIAMGHSPTAAIVRLMSNHPDYFKTALDLGAAGVMVPGIETVEDARRAVAASRYPPAGTRGCGPVRASSYFKQYDRYMESANEDVLVILQIETAEALSRLDAILAVPGVDGVFVGPSDLELSLTAREGDKPDIESVIEDVFRAARAARMPYGTLAESPAACARLISEGAQLMTIGGDLGFVIEGAAAALRNTRALFELQEAVGDLREGSYEA